MKTAREREYHRLYMREYRKTEKDKKYRKKYMLEYRFNNKEKLKRQGKEWKLKHRLIYLEAKRIRRERYRKKYPEKRKAHNYALYHKQIINKCELCDSIKTLQFHHTNYEENKGFTVCDICHKKIHGVII